jgi:hypothetical protein
MRRRGLLRSGPFRDSNFKIRRKERSRGAVGCERGVQASLVGLLVPVTSRPAVSRSLSVVRAEMSLPENADRDSFTVPPGKRRCSRYRALIDTCHWAPRVDGSETWQVVMRGPAANVSGAAPRTGFRFRTAEDRPIQGR